MNTVYILSHANKGTGIRSHHLFHLISCRFPLYSSFLSDRNSSHPSILCKYVTILFCGYLDQVSVGVIRSGKALVSSVIPTARKLTRDLQPIGWNSSLTDGAYSELMRPAHVIPTRATQGRGADRSISWRQHECRTAPACNPETGRQQPGPSRNLEGYGISFYETDSDSHKPGRTPSSHITLIPIVIFRNKRYP